MYMILQRLKGVLYLVTAGLLAWGVIAPSMYYAVSGVLVLLLAWFVLLLEKGVNYAYR